MLKARIRVILATKEKGCLLGIGGNKTCLRYFLRSLGSNSMQFVEPVQAAKYVPLILLTITPSIPVLVLSRLSFCHIALHQDLSTYQ